MLDSVSVVNVPVNDQNPFQFMMLNGISCGDSQVVEDTKPACTVRQGVMPRRTHKRKADVTPSGNEGIDAGNTPAGSQPCCQIGLCARRGVGCKVRKVIFGCFEYLFDIQNLFELMMKKSLNKFLSIFSKDISKYIKERIKVLK